MGNSELQEALQCTREGEDGGILTLRLNRPQVLNAIDWEILNGLHLAIERAESDASVRCLLIEGVGDKAFSSGADLRVLASLTSDSARDWVRLGHRTFNRFVASRIPSIAAVRGYALGGGLELALACDFRVAAESTKMGLPEIQRGWLPGWGGIRRLCAMLGPACARTLTLLGESVGAEDALEMGLVQQVVTDGRLDDAAHELAGRLARLSPRNTGQAKAQMSCCGLIIDDEEIENDANLLAEALTTEEFRAVRLSAIAPEEPGTS